LTTLEKWLEGINLTGW